MKSLRRAAAALAVLCVLSASGAVYAQTPSSPPVVTAPPSTQNTITTTGPVSSDTTISVGTVAGQALQWVVTVFGAVLGTAATALLMRMFKAAGLQISDSARVRLQEMVVNGINIGAKTAEDRLAGQGKIVIKNAAIAEAVKYVKDHGADTLKQLGVDPNSNAAVDAIKARIETAIADPMTPTPKALDSITPPVAAPAPVKV